MYLFSEDLLRLFDYLKLEKAGMSVKAFTSALQFLSASHGRVINKFLICNDSANLLHVYILSDVASNIHVIRQ